MARTLPYLPSDIIIDILTRLPVKSLMRFRCVSKSWHSQVSDPNFIDTHLTQTCAHNNGDVLAVYRSTNGGDTLLVHCGETFVEHMELECPLSGYFDVVGYCHGVLCIFLLGINRLDQHLYLWNPAIRKFKALPNSLQPGQVQRYLAFGFVPQTNDYKVLKFFRSTVGGNVGPLQFEIYSLRMNSWKKIQSLIPGEIGYFSMDTVLNGFVHFSAYKNYEFILTFDMANEVFGEIKVPECCNDVSVHHTVVTVLRGSLHLFVNCLDGENVRSYVWVMKEYGVAESWTKQFTFDKWLKPVWYGFKKNGVVLHGDDFNLISYDLRGHRVNVQINGDPKYVRAFAYYTESLVLLNEGN